MAARIVHLGVPPETVLPLILAVAWFGLAWTRTVHVATSNPCATMREEIERSCRMFESSSPLPADLYAAGRGP